VRLNLCLIQFLLNLPNVGDVPIEHVEVMGLMNPAVYILDNVVCEMHNKEF